MRVRADRKICHSLGGVYELRGHSTHSAAHTHLVISDKEFSFGVGTPLQHVPAVMRDSISNHAGCGNVLVRLIVEFYVAAGDMIEHY